MNCWSDTLKKYINRNGGAVVVTVIDVQGSAPREVGATMIVSASGISGTIGGGNLEHTCIREAGELLSSNDDLPIGLRAGLSAGTQTMFYIHV